MKLIIAAIFAAACGENALAPSDSASGQDSEPALIDGQCEGMPGGARLLVYTRENMWQHPSNPFARAALLRMCETQGFFVKTSASPRAVTAETLANIDVVVLAVTSGVTLDAPARDVLGPWLANGGGLVGIHSASATDTDFLPIAERIATQFLTHPAIMEGTVKLEGASPVTRNLPSSWRRVDEWYSFTVRPETTPVQVVLSLDETTLPPEYPADQRQGFHALAWTHTIGTSRTFYTALGHTVESYLEPYFLQMLAQGIEWSAKKSD